MTGSSGPIFAGMIFGVKHLYLGQQGLMQGWERPGSTEHSLFINKLFITSFAFNAIWA